MNDKPITLTLDEALAKRLVSDAETTSWSNPLRQPQRLEVALGPVTPYSGVIETLDEDSGVLNRRRVSGFRQTQIVVELAPGETKALPRAWDTIVHRVRDGVVIGGQAPQLRRAGQTYVVDRSLLGKADMAVPARTRMIED